MARFAVRPRQGAAPPEQTLRDSRLRTPLVCRYREIFSAPLANYPRLLYQSNRINIAAGGASTTGRQACPQGTLVISGGVGADPASQAAVRLRMELSFPDAHGWNVRAINDTGAAEAPADARVHGVCIGTAEGVDISNHRTVSFVHADVTLKPDGSTLRQSVVCKDEQAYALAGGFRLVRGRNATVELHESFPDTAVSWTVAVSNRGKSTGSAAVRLYAVCLKPYNRGRSDANSKGFRNSSLLQNSIGGKSRTQFAVDSHMNSGRRIPPDFVIAASLPFEFVSMSFNSRTTSR